MITPNVNAMRALEVFTLDLKYDFQKFNQKACEVFNYNGEATPEFKQSCSDLYNLLNPQKQNIEIMFNALEDIVHADGSSNTPTVDAAH